MQRQTLLIGSLALNAILVVALCSSMLSNNLGSTIRAQQHARVVSPVASEYPILLFFLGYSQDNG